MSEQHDACRSREQSLIRENSDLEAEIDRLRMELHLANAERRLAMRALRMVEYALAKKSETPHKKLDSSIEQNTDETDRQLSALR